VELPEKAGNKTNHQDEADENHRERRQGGGAEERGGGVRVSNSAASAAIIPTQEPLMKYACRIFYPRLRERAGQ
jgi:hypothetical protein